MKRFVTICVQDPTDLVNDRYHTDSPRTKALLYVALNRDLNEFYNDRSKPKSELFDDAILQMTLDPVIWHEIKGERSGSTEYNCAHCGAGLAVSFCRGCNHRFHDDHIRCGWTMPLSRRMVEFLREKGHEFKIDPEIARMRERKEWEKIF